MRDYELDKYISNGKLVDEKLAEFFSNKILIRQSSDLKEIDGHILKAENNLRFVNDNLSLGYLDWCINGCYYASYHAALALIITKRLSSKNHLATLLVLIKEFYQNGLDKEDIEGLAGLLDYQDILFYVESKNKREDATYSTKTIYNKQEVEQIRLKSTLFVSKVKDLLRKN